jgi:hypothetical protein
VGKLQLLPKEEEETLGKLQLLPKEEEETLEDDDALCHISRCCSSEVVGSQPPTRSHCASTVAVWTEELLRLTNFG